MLSIESVTVGEEALEAVVRVEPTMQRTSQAPGSASRVRALLPGLARHTCENERGASFLAELGDTETAHLLEHVACELMALAGSPRSLRGRTSWDFARDGSGVFRVALEFDHDLVALGALKAAPAIVGWAMSGEGEPPDVGEIARGLLALRG